MEHMYKGFSLAVVNDSLTTIGGYSNDGLLNTYTNLLFTLTGSGSNRTLEDNIFPPMLTHRHCHAAITTPTHLVVAGGRSLHRGVDVGIDVVEAMNTETLQWTTVERLPRVFRHPKMTLCEGCLYVADDYFLYSCTAKKFLKSCQISRERSTITRTDGGDGSEDSMWTRLADVPSGSNLVTLKRHLLAIGGEGTNQETSRAVLCYNRATNAWYVIPGELLIPRYDALSVCSKTNKVFVVGGYTSSWETSTISELGDVSS